MKRTAARTEAPLYHELHRPQFHFTPQKNWTNDPNGLVYYKGEYHLFYQANAKGINWGPNTWGHAVSRDLVHWEQIEDAIRPDKYGWIWSGSAVVDWQNTGGFQSGREKALVAFYTTGGWGTPRNPAVQAVAYSNDRGRTWTKYRGNPVLAHIRGDNRDPKVLWHEPTRQWVMALYLDGHDFALFGSRDLKKWERICDMHVCGSSECPDFFELPIDGNRKDTRWVFWGADGKYLLGRFDGRRFETEVGPCIGEQGPSGYAAQTWSDAPGGRLIQTSWMRGGKYPSMPFNQQMSFPVELTLKTFPEGPRLCRMPVREIEALYARRHRWQRMSLKPGANLVPKTQHDLYDITVDVSLGQADGFGMVVRGIDLRYHRRERKFTYLGRDVYTWADLKNGRLQFRVLVDRTSLELFADRGKATACFCYLPEARDWPLEFYAAGAPVRVNALSAVELKSIWK